MFVGLQFMINKWETKIHNECTEFSLWGTGFPSNLR